MADEEECSDTCTRNICEWCPEADRQAALVEAFRRQLGLDEPAPGARQHTTDGEGQQ